MPDETKLSKLEHLKEASQQLRGTIAEELQNDEDTFSGDAGQILKHHGTYCQDDRDLRKAKGPDGKPKGRVYSMMVRTRVPGGRLSAAQLLEEIDLCEKYANGTVRLTTRQGMQLHGVLKTNIRDVIRGINESKLTTLAACGDVERNVMCCPAPFNNNPVRQQMQEMTDRLAEHLRPRTTAYYDIWLTDEEGQKTNVAEFQPVEEPIYGARYLPRKFKTAIALPEDNCVDIYSQDLGFLAIVENDEVVGYNVIVGGGMGTTPSAEKCFPAVGQKMAYIRPEQVLDVAEAVVKVQRDFGNRADRKVARMKYLIANWGLPAFKEKVEEYYGQPLPEPHPADVIDVQDHLGWHEQGDGRLFLGLNIENGRIKDEGSERVKSGLRAIVSKYRMPLRVTALQSLLLCDIDPADRADIEAMLREYGMPGVEDQSLVRRYAMACPAFPTCGLAITESERVMPDVLSAVEREIEQLGLTDERIAIHMTGCPNGCARPYTPDIGLVGRAVGKYTVFLGGNTTGTRLAFLYRDHVPQDEIAPLLGRVFGQFREQRRDGELFGDFCQRLGADGLVQ